MTTTMDSALPNNINSSQNHFLKNQIFPIPNVFRFTFQKSFSRISLACGIHVGGRSTQLKPRNHEQKK